jgi:sigma-B regulation protein RsbU (phosphoserine phosphatase)
MEIEANMKRIKSRFQNKLNKIRQFINLYTSGLNRKEIERLLKKDALEAFSYYKNKTNIQDVFPESSSPRTTLYVIKEIFISFIMKLTPARRIVYGIGFLAFIWGIIHVHFGLIIASFLLLNFLLALELADKLTTRDELEIAREIQTNLQPAHIPELKLLSIAAYSRPAHIVGGDFFNIVQPHEDKLISILGDVSDKGISAALYVAYFQSMFESLADKDASPAFLLGNLNTLISRRLREGDFITAVIALFDLKEKSVTIARAGHNWPLYYHADTHTISEIKPMGISIGVYKGQQFSEMMTEEKRYLKTGDMLLLYSDGVSEAMAVDNRMFGLSGLKSVIKDNAHRSSNEIIQRINLRLSDFLQGGELADDATMMAVKVK